jgi:hypothetical protein
MRAGEVEGAAGDVGNVDESKDEEGPDASHDYFQDCRTSGAPHVYKEGNADMYGTGECFDGDSCPQLP